MDEKKHDPTTEVKNLGKHAYLHIDIAIIPEAIRRTMGGDLVDREHLSVQLVNMDGCDLCLQKVLTHAMLTDARFKAIIKAAVHEANILSAQKRPGEN